MPPAGNSRPDAKTYEASVGELESALDRGYPQKQPIPTDMELASRLASLLRNHAPYTMLLELAQKGHLKDPAIL